MRPGLPVEATCFPSERTLQSIRLSMDLARLVGPNPEGEYRPTVRSCCFSGFERERGTQIYCDLIGTRVAPATFHLPFSFTNIRSTRAWPVTEMLPLASMVLKLV